MPSRLEESAVSRSPPEPRLTCNTWHMDINSKIQHTDTLRTRGEYTLIHSERVANIHWYFKNMWRIYIDTLRTCGEYTLIHSERVANIHSRFHIRPKLHLWRIIRSGDVYTKRSGWQPGRYQWKKTSQRKKSSIVAQRLCAALSDFLFHYKYLKTFKERGMLINYIISYITMHEDYAVVEVTWRHRYLLFFYYHIHPVKSLSLQAPVFVIFNSCN